MSVFDTVIRFLEEVYIAKNFLYAEEHLSEDYIFHCSEGTKNKTEEIAFIKKYVKKHPVQKIYSTIDSSDDETITLNILFECTEKEKFLGITVGENKCYYKHIETFKVKNGLITESHKNDQNEP